mmetsp:Transcript_44535/g.83555  ORF Transcript_44535/g.83555 Transcript_44535/m.83555 type:complete len:283 (+) Transcript_44535:2199-3047(+)
MRRLQLHLHCGDHLPKGLFLLHVLHNLPQDAKASHNRLPLALLEELGDGGLQCAQAHGIKDLHLAERGAHAVDDLRSEVVLLLLFVTGVSSRPGLQVVIQLHEEIYADLEDSAKAIWNLQHHLRLAFQQGAEHLECHSLDLSISMLIGNRTEHRQDVGSHVFPVAVSRLLRGDEEGLEHCLQLRGVAATGKLRDDGEDLWHEWQELGPLLLVLHVANDLADHTRSVGTHQLGSVCQAEAHDLQGLLSAGHQHLPDRARHLLHSPQGVRSEAWGFRAIHDNAH